MSYLSTEKLYAQTNDYRFQAILLKTFIQNTEFPSSVLKNEVRVGILANNMAFDKIKGEITSIKGKPVKIVRINNLEDSQQCHLVFIASNYSNKFYIVHKCCRDKPIVIVTEKEGLGKSGSCFNIIPNPKNPSRLAFEINQTSIKEKGLNVSQRISNMGILL